MHKRAKTILMAFVVIPLLTTAVGGCGRDDGGAQKPAASRVEILEVKVENNQYAALDLDRAGPSVGDMDVFSGNAMKDGRKVGHGGGSCQVIHIDGKEATVQCLLTMELKHGSVTMQALWVKGSSPLTMAITGGTDAYRDARGTVRFWDIGTPNERVRAEIIR